MNFDGKTWMTPELMREFLATLNRACIEISQKPVQGCFCSCGNNYQVDWKAGTRSVTTDQEWTLHGGRNGPMPESHCRDLQTIFHRYLDPPFGGCGRVSSNSTQPCLSFFESAYYSSIKGLSDE